jgi:hypothetical protein
VVMIRAVFGNVEAFESCYQLRMGKIEDVQSRTLNYLVMKVKINILIIMVWLGKLNQ